MSLIDYLFIFSVALAVLGVWVWQRGLSRRESPTRIIVWTRTPLEEAELARVFREWDHADPRLQAVLQWMQEWLENAQGDVLAKREEGKALNTAAGGAHWLECAHADLVRRVTEGR